MLQPVQITEYFIENMLNPGDIVVDATAGNGNDTLKLCNAVGNTGLVYAFDIQKQALINTETKLKEYGFSNFKLIEASHSELDTYVTSPVKAVLFNLGYLPGGDHNVHTSPDTTIPAIEKSLQILSPDGFVSVCIYYGKNSGTFEKEIVVDFLKTIDSKKYTVLLCDFLNRPNCPPLTAIIVRNSR